MGVDKYLIQRSILFSSNSPNPLPFDPFPPIIFTLTELTSVDFGDFANPANQFPLANCRIKCDISLSLNPTIHRTLRSKVKIIGDVDGLPVAPPMKNNINLSTIRNITG